MKQPRPRNSIEAQFMSAIVSLSDILDVNYLHELPERIKLSISVVGLMRSYEQTEITEEAVIRAAKNLENVILNIPQQNDIDIRVIGCQDCEIYKLQNGDFRLVFTLPRKTIEIIHEYVLEDYTFTQRTGT